MSGRFTGGQGYPFAGPFASSQDARNPRSHAVFARLAPMTLSVPSFLFLASPAPRRRLPAPGKGGGGR